MKRLQNIQVLKPLLYYITETDGKAILYLEIRLALPFIRRMRLACRDAPRVKLWLKLTPVPYQKHFFGEG